VKRETGGSQQPWVSSSPIDGSFYFASPAAAGQKVATAPQPESADAPRPAPGIAPQASREAEQPRGNDNGGGSSFDGTWAYTGIGTNCRGSGTGLLIISGSLVSSRNHNIGRVSPDGTYRSASISTDGVPLTATGKMSGNSGSGSYRRADGCNGRWTAKRQ
jgi:hypothetical protein